MTKQRQLVLSIVEESNNHPTAKEVFELAKKHMPGITFATIYNNLNRLVDDGKILRIRIPDHPDHFDHTLKRHNHIVCDKCGKVKDVALSDYVAKISKEINIPLTGVEICLHYVCEDCLKKERKE